LGSRFLWWRRRWRHDEHSREQDGRGRVHQALFTKGDLLAVDRYPADDFVAHDPPVAGLSGEAAGFRDAAATLRVAFPTSLSTPRSAR
jgi:hypothetical protein